MTLNDLEGTPLTFFTSHTYQVYRLSPLADLGFTHLRNISDINRQHLPEKMEKIPSYENSGKLLFYFFDPQKICLDCPIVAHAQNLWHRPALLQYELCF